MIDFGMPTLIELPSIERSASLCRRLGLKFIELNMSFPQNQLEKLDAGRLKKIADKFGIYYTVHIDESFDPCCANAGAAKAYVQYFMDTIELAKELGIPTLNMHLLRGIYVTLPHKRVFIHEENEAFYLERLRLFRDAAEKAIGESNVKICVENTDGFDLPFLQHALDLLLESPVFALTFDIGHDHAIKGIDRPIIMEREERLYHMHMHDALGSNVHLALGDGELDLWEYLSLAQKHSCRVVLETKTLAALKSSAGWIAHWLNRQSRKDELWDLLDADRKPLGIVHPRGKPMPEGFYHLAAHVWARNAQGQYLLTQRCPGKSYAGLWEYSGGSALAGESSLQAAKRELLEETGLSAADENCRLIQSVRGERSFSDVWLFDIDFSAEDIKLQQEETSGFMLKTAEEILAMEQEGTLAPCGDIRDFFVRVGEIL